MHGLMPAVHSCRWADELLDRGDDLRFPLHAGEVNTVFFCEVTPRRDGETVESWLGGGRRTWDHPPREVYDSATSSGTVTVCFVSRFVSVVITCLLC